MWSQWIVQTVLAIHVVGYHLAASDVTGRDKQPGICSKERFQNCQSSLQSQMELGHMTNRKQLSDFCRSLKQSLDCVDDHMQRCFGTTEKTVYLHVTAGARKFVHGLCTRGTVQEDFLRHAPCLTNTSSGENCSHIYDDLLRLSQHLSQMHDAEEGLRKTCCKYQDFVGCKHQLAERMCGIEAAAFQRHHLDSISVNLIQNHCSHMTDDPKGCQTSDRANWIVRANWLAILIVVVAFIGWTNGFHVDQSS